MGSCLSIVEEILQQSQESGPSSTNNAAAGTGTQTPASGGGPSPVHDSLPPGAERHRVRNVYDGDTLTLTDERRVRLLGIDTPEIKEKQAYSIEAKEYTKSRCNKKEICLSFEGDGKDREDHYGRLLAFVWVPDAEGEGRFLCVNEGIVAAGLANVYAPNSSSRVHNWDKMIAMQKQARLQELGMWSTFEDFYVVKTTNGAAYHNRDCRHLAKSKHLADLKVSAALDKGLHPCRTCLADA